VTAPRAMGPGAAESPRGERRAAARGVAWGGVESLTGAAVGLLLTPFVVRTCGLDGLGMWAASWSLAHTTNLLDLGVGSSYTRFTSQTIAVADVARLNRTVSAGTGFHLAIAVLVACVAVVAGPAALGIVVPAGPLAIQARSVFGCTLATVLLRTVLSAYRGVVAGAQRLDALGRIGAVAAIAEGAGAATALLNGWGIAGMAINSLLVGTGASLAEARVAHRLVRGLRVVPFLSAGRDEWRDLLSFGLRLQVVRASEILSAHAPRLALAAGAGLTPAGLYDLGARVAGLLQISALPLPVIQPLAGRLTALADTERLRELADRATRYVALLAIPSALMILLDASGILRAWTGQTVPSISAATARWLALSSLCAAIVSPLRLVLRGCGRAGPEALSALAGSLMSAGLAVGLAPRWGAVGVASSVLCGALLSATVLIVGAHRVSIGLAAASVRHLPAVLLASVSGFAAAVLLRSAAGGLDAAVLSRLECVLHLVPEAILLGTVTFLVALWSGALLPRDAREMAGALLPSRLRHRAQAAVVGGRRA